MRGIIGSLGRRANREIRGVGIEQPETGRFPLQ